MSGTSFQSFFEWQQNVSPRGFALKTFEACLVSRMEAYSRPIAHHWKVLVTPLQRFVFQLAPSQLRTEGTGCGLLPTPDTQGHRDGSVLRKDNNLSEGGAHGVSLHHKIASLIPTPQARDHFPAHKPEYVAEKKAEGHGMSNLNDTIALLPTPKAQNSNGAGIHGTGGLDLQTTIAMLPTPGTPRPHDTDETAGVYYPSQNQRDLTTIMHETEKLGSKLRLEPAFVMYMMGYPEDWCDLKDGE